MHKYSLTLGAMVKIGKLVAIITFVLAVVSVEITPEIRRGFDACAMFETPEGGKVSDEEYAMAAQIFLDGTMKDLLDGIED